MGYVRLTRDERYQIEALVTSGLSLRKIGRQLGRYPSTIFREMKKVRKLNTGYRAFSAHQLTLARRHRPRPDLRRIRAKLELHIRAKLELDWSPEQIVGRMHLEGRREVSWMTIYRYVRRDKAAGGQLWRHLRILRTLRKKRTGPGWKPRQYLADRVNIDKRPKIVEDRIRLGDFERDTVLGRRGKSVLLTIVDRRSRLLKLAHVRKNTCDAIHSKTISLLKGERVHTLTNDNGFEFLRHRKTAQALSAPIYFANRYRSWERGTNENTNGLLRQYFPKKKDIGNLSRNRLKAVTDLINSRPRKMHGYRTADEIHQLLKSGNVALDV